ncbi:MAG TPA: extracellular solute-binding protein [Streptosporangiaceae bacterium]|jgi:raffinose/stachyose/melibiose transport system substrate-binding protein
MRRRGALLAATGLVAAVTLPACAPSTNGGGDDKVHLTVLSWRPEDTSGYQKIFATYEKSHPKVKVDFKGIKSTDYLAVLPNEVKKTQGGPDVVQLKPYGPIQSLITGGNLVPLDGQVDVSGWPAETLQAAKGQQDGKLYGVPFALQTIQVLYNKKIFADQQISPPKTWDELMAANAKLKKAGITPMATSGLQPWVLAIDHQIFGATRYGAGDFSKAAVAGKKDFTDANYLASLDVVKELKPYFPDKVTAVDYPDAQTLFTSGKAAMYPGGSYELGPFKKTSPDLDIGFFEAPPAPGSMVDHPVTSGWVDGSYGLNAKSQHRAEALELVKWMATKEFGQLFANELKQISAVPGTTPGDPMLAEMLNNFQEHGAPYMMLVSFGYGNPLGRDAEGTALQKMLNGQASASDAGKEIQKGIDAWFKPSGG